LSRVFLDLTGFLALAALLALVGMAYMLPLYGPARKLAAIPDRSHPPRPKQPRTGICGAVQNISRTCPQTDSNERSFRR
jgi:hypothetical protein